MDLNLGGKVALITGPAKGMGAAISQAFAAEGCDVTDEGQGEAAVEVARRQFGGAIDILVNVAGGTGPIGKTGAQTTSAEFRDIVDVNMAGCFNMIWACMSRFRCVWT